MLNNVIRSCASRHKVQQHLKVVVFMFGGITSQVYFYISNINFSSNFLSDRKSNWNTCSHLNKSFTHFNLYWEKKLEDSEQCIVIEITFSFLQFMF